MVDWTHEKPNPENFCPKCEHGMGDKGWCRWCGWNRPAPEAHVETRAEIEVKCSGKFEVPDFEGVPFIPHYVENGPDWQRLQDEVAVWANSIFGNSTLHAKMEHLRKETIEVEENPDNHHEWADVFLIFLHGLAAQGISMDDLYKVTRIVFEIVKEREWGEPDEHGVVEHIREEPPPS